MNYNYPNIRILMVGVGGIGCEVLKMVTKFTFKEFHIIDMDTIEVSNLNRQFLFRLEHRGKSKAIVAAETMKKLAPQLNIIPHFAGINTHGYTMDFFRQFDAVIMALDNAETRSYVNKVCQALGIFTVDAGSMGYKGQANAYYEGGSCYDCQPISTTQKQYPACTIRSQPTSCTHCVIWAKYLFTQLFSGEVGILEIEGFDQNSGESVFNKFFKGEEMPIQHELCKEFTLIGKYHHNISHQDTLQELQGMWFYSFQKLNEQKNQLQQLVYDKDDELHVLFIFASTVLRCRNFKIEQFDYQKIKTISGNIVHAIASTNSIVAALEVQKLIFFLENFNKVQYFSEIVGPTYIMNTKKDKILPSKIQIRNTQCNSCFSNQIYCSIDFLQTTLGQLINHIKKLYNNQINIISLSRIIYDDEEENDAILIKTLDTIFNVELDNRLIIKSIDEELLAILWLSHQQDQIVIEIKPTKLSNRILQLTHKLQEKKRQRIRNTQEVKEILELPSKQPVEILESPKREPDFIID